MPKNERSDEINSLHKYLMYDPSGQELRSPFTADEDSTFIELMDLITASTNDLFHFQKLFEILELRYSRTHWQEFMIKHKGCFNFLMATFASHCANLNPWQISNILQYLDGLKFTFQLDEVHYGLLRSILKALCNYIEEHKYTLTDGQHYINHPLFPKHICNIMYYLAKNKCEVRDIRQTPWLEKELFSLLSLYVQNECPGINFNLNDITKVLHGLCSMGYEIESFSPAWISLIIELSRIAREQLKNAENRNNYVHNVISLFYSLCTMNLLEPDTFQYLVETIGGFSMRDLNKTQKIMVCQAAYLYLQRNSSVDEGWVFNQLGELIGSAQATLLGQARTSNPQRELFCILQQILKEKEYEGSFVYSEHLIDWCVVDHFLEIGGRKLVIEYSGRVHNTYAGEDNVAARRKAGYLKREGYEVVAIKHEVFNELTTPEEKYKYVKSVLSSVLCQQLQVKRARPTF